LSLEIGVDCGAGVGLAVGPAEGVGLAAATGVLPELLSDATGSACDGGAPFNTSAPASATATSSGAITRGTIRNRLSLSCVVSQCFFSEASRDPFFISKAISNRFFISKAISNRFFIAASASIIFFRPHGAGAI
jgi:hypothetical protein